MLVRLSRWAWGGGRCHPKELGSGSLQWLSEAGFQATDLKGRVAWACPDLQSRSAKHFSACISDTDQETCICSSWRLPCYAQRPAAHSRSLQHVVRPELLREQGQEEIQWQGNYNALLEGTASRKLTLGLWWFICLQPPTSSTTIHTDTA